MCKPWLSQEVAIPENAATNSRLSSKCKIFDYASGRTVLAECSSSSMRLAEHVTTLRTWRLIASLVRRKPGVLRPGFVAMRGQGSYLTMACMTPIQIETYWVLIRCGSPPKGYVSNVNLGPPQSTYMKQLHFQDGEHRGHPEGQNCHL